MKKLGLLFCAALALSSCTENMKVKSFGGTSTIEIPADQKFVLATWKDENLWITTKTRQAADSVKSEYRFAEKSSLGVMEGTYIITEK
jgi:hypothetical protein